MKWSRLVFVSASTGAFISSLISAAMWATKIGPWFPPLWPGWFLAIASAALTGRQWGELTAIGIITIGNAGFYAFMFLWLIRYDALSNGRIGRYFLR